MEVLRDSFVDAPSPNAGNTALPSPRNPRRDQVMGKNGWKNIGDENKINKLCGANLVSRSKLVVVVAVGLDEVAFSFPFSLLWHPNFGRKMKDFAYKCVL